MASRVLSTLLELIAFSVILYFVSVDGLEVFFVDGWFCCLALLRLAAGLTLSALVGLCVCMVLFALRFIVRVAGPCKVKKLSGKRDYDAYLCSLLLFLLVRSVAVR